MKLHEILDGFTNNYRPVDVGVEARLTVSFVIPVFNSAESIRYSVESILKQNCIHLVREIILVNDGSTDKSKQELIRLQNDFTGASIIVLDNEGRKYAAYARNRGIERATADLVCFIDSDIILPIDYVEKHILVQQVNRGISFSLRANIDSAEKITFPVSYTRDDFRYGLLGNFGYELNNAAFQFCDTHTLPELCLTCAVTYWRQDLVDVKGCPENFVGWGFNDTAMAAKVISLGRPVMPLLDAGVLHLEHAPRSGRTSKKWVEFAQNKKRYTKMLQLPTLQTFNYHVEALE